jgi:hypothetical protein
MQSTNMGYLSPSFSQNTAEKVPAAVATIGGMGCPPGAGALGSVWCGGWGEGNGDNAGVAATADLNEEIKYLFAPLGDLADGDVSNGEWDVAFGEGLLMQDDLGTSASAITDGALVDY